MDVSPNLNPIPFNAAQAYGLRTPGLTPAPAAPAYRPIADTAQPARAAAVQEQVQLRYRPNVDKLVAATVPGGINFNTGAAPQPTGSLQIYRHPADKNAAATGVTLGKSLDLEA